MTRILTLIFLFGLLLYAGPARAGDELEKAFANPPDSSKPWVYWWWLDSNATKEGITLDLEEMQRQGIGGALVFDAGTGHTSPVGPKFMSDPWRELFKHAVNEADRLGLKLSFNICSGWDCGGTWVPAEHTMKQLVSSETRTKGPSSFSGMLSKPPVRDDYYEDTAVLAFPLPRLSETNSLAMDRASMKLTASSTYQNHYTTALTRDHDAKTRWVSNGDKPGMGPTDSKPEFLQFQFDEPFTAAAMFIEPYPECGPRDCQIQISQDGTTFETVRHFTVEQNKPLAVTFDDVRARTFRLLITSSYPFRGQGSWNVQISEIQLLQEGEKPQKQNMLPPLDSRTLIVLTDKLDASGRLKWNVPEGKWQILRLGQTSAGKRTKLASRGSVGLEIDAMSREALDLHFAETGAKVIADAGPLAGKTLLYFHDDSWEIGEPNWTPEIIDEFQRRRGYDPLPYLPILLGRTIDSKEVSARFRRDFDRTLADLVADNHYGHLRDLAHGNGMGTHPEAGGPHYIHTIDPLMCLGRTDIPMGEFWVRKWEPDGATYYETRFSLCDTVKQAASAAHVYGKKLCQAEAFTNRGRNWEEDPFMMKAINDRALCNGLTRVMLCFYVHQPYTDIKPGYEWPGAGTHFDRNITWWNQMDAFAGYIGRSQFLLQQGMFVADTCYYVGEDVPCYVPAKHMENPPLPRGYDKDAINSEVLMTRVSVRDGRIVLPDGMSYALLVLPELDTMTPKSLDKIAELVQAGATVVGPRPTSSPSLKNYPQCDQQVQTLADKLWGDIDGDAVKEHMTGKGRIIYGHTLQEILLASGIKPDFEFADARADANLDYIHRSSPNADIYFVSNQLDRTEEAQCTFRIAGRQPELWDAVTGDIRNAVAFTQTDDDRTTVPLKLPPRGSIFVVFRKPIPKTQHGTAATNWPTLSPTVDLDGPWTVRFDPEWGGPKSVVFEELDDWTKRPEPGVKHYSGTATYQRTFDLPETLRGGKQPVYLNLGKVNNLAEVRLNGKELGVVWTAPWQVEITGAVQPTGNKLEIDVVNLWPNRLIGDAALPPDERLTVTNVTKFKKDSPLMPSGLLGPVTVQADTP